MMNRPENAIYILEQSAATAPNENTEGDRVGTSEKLTGSMTNSMNPPSTNVPAVRTHATMMGNDTEMWRLPNKSTTSHSAPGSTSTNQNDLPMPKRNLSSYNLFFQVERENIIKGEEGMNYTHENIARVALRHYQQGKTEQPRRKHRKTHGKISFAELARSVANKWKELDPSTKEMFVHRTNIEKARYQAEIAEWADKKLRSKPPRERDQPTDTFTLVDIFKPNINPSANYGADGINRASGQNDAMLQPEYIMPHRVFPPSTTSHVARSQPTTHVSIGSATSDLNNTRFTDTYSHYSPNSGLVVEPNNVYDFTQRYRTTNEYDTQMQQQYPQLNLQRRPTTFDMTLQQQFVMMTERHGIGDFQPQPLTQGYQTSFSMRSQGQIPSQWGQTFAPMPNDNYNSTETFSNSIQQPSMFGTEGMMHVDDPGQMRNEAKAEDNNETLDLQSLFHRFDSN